MEPRCAFRLNIVSLADILPVVASGALIGLVLGLVGGGGSILAVPLLIYVVGVDSTHQAIGTAAVAVAVNAIAGLGGHARKGNVKWPCAFVFGLAGVVGAAIGAAIGKSVDGAKLLTMFGLLMVGVGLSMLRKRRRPDDPGVRLTRQNAPHLLPRLVPTGFGVGLGAGFFGIGGGFLIVPGLMAATAMPIVAAVGTSLFVVAALGATTAISYALSGFVDWRLVGLLMVGGAAGAVSGIAIGRILADRKSLLERLFAGLVISVGIYILVGGA